MSRINTNIGALQAQHRLNYNQADLSTRLQRLSTGLKINAGKDAPAGLIASETLRSEIAGITQAVDNSQRANNVINTAEGSLSEVSSLLLEVQSLTNQAANSGALSPQEIAANQLQVDAILNSVNRISNTTQFNGVKLLNGGLDYTLSGVVSADIDIATVNAAKIPDNGAITVAVQVTASAQLGKITYTASGIGGSPTTIEIAGNIGTEQLSFAASAQNSAISFAINQLKESTGVSASVVAGDLEIYSTAYGSTQFVSVKTITGTFTTGKDFGADAAVTINGSAASVEGKVATVRTGDLDITLDLDAAFAQNTATGITSFNITGGGAKFQLGERVERQGQVNIGISSVATTKLGNATVGYLSSLASDGANSLVGGNTIQAQKILDASIKQVAEIRGRLGAFQKNVVETNVNSLNVALENVTAAQSQIRDADFAAETASLTRAQILVQANTSVLAQANASPQNVLSLLG
ncbi:flagellin N-terminal helical domain-containing protein [Humisphaera borealis]|uniref:Flagellin n=1 Tax=Humisphaera borealis TaxID=2807512 RepID=A0A7M2WUH7_9BACT|nr:flagellin [Humisphaera borealis]QOV89099.1 flagellin [Humisphaera borealis]